jgi:PAS domain S-box-containing protein
MTSTSTSRATSAAGAEGQQSINWFELIVEGAPDAIVMADGDGIITLVNGKTEGLFGYRRTELIGKPIDMLVRPKFHDQHPDHAGSFLMDPKTRVMGAARDLFGVRKDGVEVPIEIGLNPIDTPDGRFTLASIIDVTERKRAEEAQLQMAALVASAEDAIISKSLDGVVRSWNPGAERLLGYTAEEIVGQSVTRLLPEDRQEEEIVIIERIQTGQRVAHFETVRRRKDGSLIDVSLTISPIRNRHGAIVGASKVMRDITDRKRHKQELRRSNAELALMNRELDEFVYTASHDLKAPLTGVSAVAQWILEDDRTLCPETRSRLALIQGRIERMHRLLNDVRDYARASRPSEPAGNPVIAATLVAEIASTLHVPSGFSIRCDLTLQEIHVMRVPLELVLHNLIGNAIKHHDMEGGTVTVSAHARGAWIRFSVVDDGPGIADEYHGVVFEMFRTLQPRDAVEGSGMGLALVRKIVGKMGGSCGIEPTSGRGAHFWFDWPRSG